MTFQIQPDSYPLDRNPAPTGGTGAIRLELDWHPGFFLQCTMTANLDVAGTAAQEVTNAKESLAVAEHVIANLKDEVCSDADYNKSKNEENETGDALDLVDSVLISPDCQTGWKDDYIIKLIDEKLKAINLKMERMKINRSRGSFTSCLVKIESVRKKNIEEQNFSARNRNWTLKIM